MEAVITKSHHITYNTYFGPQDPRLKQHAIAIERKFLMSTWNKYIAVFNTNLEGALVVRLSRVVRNDLTISEDQISTSARERIIREVQNNLPRGHKVVGVSNLMPSQYGQGGAYVFPVRLHVPEPTYEVDIGPYVKQLQDLTSDNPGTWKPEGGGYYSY